MEYEILDQPQENYRPERIASQPEPFEQDADLLEDEPQLS